MDVPTNRNQPASSTTTNSTNTHFTETANELLKEGKKIANNLYEDGKKQVAEVQETIKNYSNELAHKVEAKPLTSLLIAAGIGFILSALLRR